MAINFTLIDNAPYGLPSDENHLNFAWNKGQVFFSSARRGDGLSCHFSARKANLRQIKQAINEFVEFAFFLFPWCKMIMAVVPISGSVSRLIIKLGFELVSANDVALYIKER